MGQQIADKKGITNVSVHIGASDLVCTCICQSTSDLMQLLTDIRSLEGVDRANWSEEAYCIEPSSKTHLASCILN
jgi:hypothetical protein